MGKTLTSIVLVAAAIAVNVIPGVGQAISATLVSAGLTATAAAALSTAVITGITAAGLQAGAGLLGIGPSLPKPSTTESALKSPIPPRVRAYGRGRLYGAYALYETAENGTAVDVFAIHDGRIDGIEHRYLGDEQITLSGTTVNAGADGRYKGGAVRWYETLGPTVNTAFAAIVGLLPGIWTAAHRGDGVVTIATTWKSVKAKDYQETYPGSGPVAASIVARWQPVFDWRDPSQSVSNPATWKWSENAALHLAHYRLVVEKAYRAVNEAFPSGAALQAAWDVFFAPTLAYWTAAANVCDEAVPLKGGGTEPRYRSSVSHKLNDPHKGVIDAITACFDGWTSPRADGALVVYAGRYYAPTVSIGPEHIVSYGWQTGIDDESTVNEITLSYISADHDWGPVETDPWENLDDIARRGRVRSQPLENPVPSHGQARRLAKRAMARIMAPTRGTITTNVAGRIARGQRYIRLRVVEAGAVFFDGVAEITQLTRNLQTGGVTFSWVAADANIDAWNPATEEGEPAASGNRVAPQPLDAPTITAVSALFSEATEEGSGARLVITVDGPDRDDLTWFARWRVLGASVWNEQTYTDVDPLEAVVLQTDLVPLSSIVEVEAAYQVGDGRVSPYSMPATQVDTSIDAEPPAAATAVTLTNWGDTLDLSTGPISRARGYRWRVFAQYTYQPALYQAGPAANYNFEPGSATRSVTGSNWNGNFYGSQSLVGECLFIFRMATDSIFAGISDGREYAGGPSDFLYLDYSIQDNGSAWRIWENGAHVIDYPAIAGINNRRNQVFAIGYKGTTVTYYILGNDGNFVAFRTVETAAGRAFYPGGAGVSDGQKIDQMQFRADADDLRLVIPPVLVRTIQTTTRQVSYTKAQATADGIRRAYTVDVAGVNGAGVGPVATSALLTNPPPPIVTGVNTPDDASTAAVSFNLLSGVADLAGYVIAYSTTPGFDPLAQGFLATNNGASPQYLYGLAAGTYYVRVAAFDTWTDNPRLLNFSNEDSFVITAGGGSSGGGGGTGGGGGGYCVTEDTPVLLADGTERAAGMLKVGDVVRTQHEETMVWGTFPVAAVEVVDSDDVWDALGIKATGEHRVWLNGWVRMRDIGSPARPARVVKITIDEAHTYYSAGVLSHNIKSRDNLEP